MDIGSDSVTTQDKTEEKMSKLQPSLNIKSQDAKLKRETSTTYFILSGLQRKGQPKTCFEKNAEVAISISLSTVALKRETSPTNIGT